MNTVIQVVNVLNSVFVNQLEHINMQLSWIQAAQT